MRRKKLIWQLFPPFIIITLTSLLATTIYVTKYWRQLYLDQLTTSLLKLTHVVEPQLNPLLVDKDFSKIDNLAKYIGKQTNIRFSIILPDGKVVGDSDYDPDKMENHGDRPEFQAALKGESGISNRRSYTLDERMIYVALPIKADGKIIGIIRTALLVTNIDKTLWDLYLKIITGSLAIALLAAAVILFITRRLSRPLAEINRGAERFARGDLSSKVPVPESEELANLAESLNNMAAQLDDRFRTITQQRQEQEAILSSMVEGVLAVDNKDCLITLNKAGSRLLMVNPEVGKRTQYPGNHTQQRSSPLSPSDQNLSDTGRERDRFKWFK